MTTIPPLRAGVIGLGVGVSHIKGFQSLQRANQSVELVALCDSNLARLNESGDQYGVAAAGRFTDYKAMLAEAKLDLLSICLPNALHREVGQAALEAGAHVLCEKPLATSAADVQAMIAAAEANQRRLMVAYNYRYRADIAWIRQLLAEGKLGQVYHIDASWRRETGIPGSGWFGSKALAGGGPLIDLGVHVLDLSLWLLGFPAVKTVSGSTRGHFGARGQKVWGLPRWLENKNEATFDVEDGAVGFLRLDGNLSMSLQATWAEHRAPKDDSIRLEFQGTEGTAVLNILNYRNEDTLRLYTSVAGSPVTITPVINWGSTSGHELLVADVVKALRNNLPSPTTAEQGLQTVRVLEAMYQSAAAGREVVLEG
jgi:predicted dehydrogenase